MLPPRASPSAPPRSQSLSQPIFKTRSKPRTIRIGNMQAKGYLEGDFEEAFQRYMSPSDREAKGRLLGLVSPTDSGASPAGGEEKTEGGGRETEDRGRKTEDGEQKTGDGRNEAGDPPSSGHGGRGEHKSDGAGEAQGGEAAAA